MNTLSTSHEAHYWLFQHIAPIGLNKRFHWAKKWREMKWFHLHYGYQNVFTSYWVETLSITRRARELDKFPPLFQNDQKNVWKFLKRRKNPLLIPCNLTYHFWKNWIFLRFVPYIHFEVSYERKINCNRVARCYMCWLKQKNMFGKHFLCF